MSKLGKYTTPSTFDDHLRGEPIAAVTISAQQMRFYEGRRKLVPLGGIATTDDCGARTGVAGSYRCILGPIQ